MMFKVLPFTPILNLHICLHIMSLQDCTSAVSLISVTLSSKKGPQSKDLCCVLFEMHPCVVWVHLYCQV